MPGTISQLAVFLSAGAGEGELAPMRNGDRPAPPPTEEVMQMGRREYDLPFGLLFERSPRAVQLRRRAGASTGATLLFLGLLGALGLAVFALGVLLLMLAGSTTLLLHDEERRRRLRARITGRDRRDQLRAPLSSRFRSALSNEGASVAGDGRGALRAAGRLLPTLERGAATGTVSANDDAAAGCRCHTLGTRLRRCGRAEHAAALHEAARLIFAETGDRRSEAVAANGLGLALFSAGDREASFAQFERARRLLHAVGDREREARVTANLALAKLRSGANDEAAELLRTALEQLTPDTPDYRQVAERLREAC
jgi:tetratricopeptide (TPR) repeat protein